MDSRLRGNDRINNEPSSSFRRKPESSFLHLDSGFRRNDGKYFLAILLVFLLSACASTPPLPEIKNYADHPAYDAFAERMVETHGFERAHLNKLFRHTERQQSILDAISRPAEAMPWHRYKPIFLGEQRIEAGVAFWQQHAALIQKAAQQFGVDPRIIAAIIGVETNYGGNTGSYQVIDALSTLGFDYPPRADFFRGELEEFLLLTREENIDPLKAQGSYAGAMGFGQFIPSSYRAYAVDFDNDGQRVLWQWPDAIGSVASYFSRHGWQYKQLVLVPIVAPKDAAYEPGMHKVEVTQLREQGFVFSEGVAADEDTWLIVLETEDGLAYHLGLKNFYVITRYNHSPLYAMAVHLLSREIAARYYGAMDDDTQSRD